MFPQMINADVYLEGELISRANPELPPFSFEDPPHYIRSINRPFSVDIECPVECEIDGPAFNRLIGFDASPFPDASGFSLVFSKPYQVQRRKHKKKRINKKWTKRYGYVTKYKKVKLDEVYFKDTDKDEYNFYTKNIEVVG